MKYLIVFKLLGQSVYNIYVKSVVHIFPIYCKILYQDKF